MADIRSKPVSNDGDPTFKDVTVEACLCGNRTFYIVATFDDGTISGWFTEAMCFDCNAWYRVPAPVETADEPYVTV